MRYFLTAECVLKQLETPSVYHVKKDDLFELDKESFEFLSRCGATEGCHSERNDFIAYCLKEDILTTHKAPSRNTSLPMQSPEPSLRYLELQITSRCNLVCTHCYLKSSPAGSPWGTPEAQSHRRARADLGAGRIRRVLKEFEEMQGLRVLITGGEPLVHREFREINEMLPGFLVRKVLFTNGLLLTEDLLKTLNVDEIQISVDGLEKAHDFLRGKGTFRSALAAVRRALDTGFEVSVATMIHPMNLVDFEGMERLFERLGIKDWTVDVPCISGGRKEHEALHVPPEIGGRLLGYGYGQGLHTGASGFACGLHLAAVLADGRVAKCTFFEDHPVGTIEETLGKCWERIKPIGLEKLACDCEHIESCRGGCRYRAQIFGDPLGKDFYRCALYDIL